MAGIIDLGDGHAVEVLEFKGETSGADVYHPGCKSPGFIPFTGKAYANEFKGAIETWELQFEDPLTVSPSILCRVCGDHGFIRSGRWERA
jgi:hypothetical protein